MKPTPFAMPKVLEDAVAQGIAAAAYRSVRVDRQAAASKTRDQLAPSRADETLVLHAIHIASFTPGVWNILLQHPDLDPGLTQTFQAAGGTPIHGFIRVTQSSPLHYEATNMSLVAENLELRLDGVLVSQANRDRFERLVAAHADAAGFGVPARAYARETRLYAEGV